MLLNVDFKNLEVVAAAYLSQDEVMCAEVRNGLDFHGLNQEKFNLLDRNTAKIFMFRIIYGGTQFATDPKFIHVSRSQKFWKKVIDDFYAKYKGLYRWHENLMREATRTNCIVMPTGRFYNFFPKMDRWPRTQILNYPVQGLAADLVGIARVSLRKRMKEAKLSSLIVSSIHDSIVVDSRIEECYPVFKHMQEVVKDVPMNFEKLFKTPFNLPLTGEYHWGQNKGNMVLWDGKEIVNV